MTNPPLVAAQVVTPQTRQVRIWPKAKLLVASIGLVLATTACVTVPEPPVLAATGEPDPVLVVGRDVWAKHCVRCHGAEGNGGRGPSLSQGAVAEKYPNPEVQASIIAQGLNGKMPGFRTLLTAEELEAVVAYTRSVL